MGNNNGQMIFGKGEEEEKVLEEEDILILENEEVGR